MGIMADEDAKLSKAGAELARQRGVLAGNQFDSVAFLRFAASLGATVSQAEAGAMLGVSKPRAGQLLADGRLQPGDDGHVTVRSIVEELGARTAKAATGITLAAAARRLGVTRTRVDQLVKAGRLVRVGPRGPVDERSLEALIAERSARPSPGLTPAAPRDELIKRLGVLTSLSGMEAAAYEARFGLDRDGRPRTVDEVAAALRVSPLTIADLLRLVERDHPDGS